MNFSFLQKYKPSYFISAYEILLNSLQNLSRYTLEQTLWKSVTNLEKHSLLSTEKRSLSAINLKRNGMRQDSEKIRGFFTLQRRISSSALFSVSEIETSETDTELRCKLSNPHFRVNHTKRACWLHLPFSKAEKFMSRCLEIYVSSHHHCGI